MSGVVTSFEFRRCGDATDGGAEWTDGDGTGGGAEWSEGDATGGGAGDGVIVVVVGGGARKSSIIFSSITASHRGRSVNGI